MSWPILPIGSKHKADSLLKYDIRVLKGEEFNAPIWLVIDFVERDIKQLEKSGFDWHRKTLESHLKRFKEDCRGYESSTPVSEAVGDSSGSPAGLTPADSCPNNHGPEGSETHHSRSEGGDSCV